MAHWDKDERYMATTDLSTALARDDLKLDSNLEKRIVASILRQLDDKNNDVQSVAVKCLGILLKKVQEVQIGEICEKLCQLILGEGQEVLRDIYSMGLQKLIAEVPEMMGPLVSQKLAGRLLNGISKTPGSDDIKRECLDNMSDMLRRFGHLVPREHEEIMRVVVQQLDHEKQVIRKRAALCLGSLAVVSSDPLLNNLVETILGLIRGADSKVGGSDIRTLIQTIGTISRTVGYRLGRHLDHLVPLFLRMCGDPADESQQTNNANELREHCFPGLESFVLRCPREVAPHLNEILRVSLDFMVYDPNYSYGEDEDGDDMDEDGDGDDEDGYDEEDYGGSDDDDTSWKVRKAAVKAITAVINTRPEMLHQLYEVCADALIGRFKEREENVRLDIMLCFSNLLQATLVHSSNRDQAVHVGVFPPQPPKLQRERSTLGYLQDKVGPIVRASRKQLQKAAAGGDTKTKSTVFAMLRTLLHVLKGGLDDHLEHLLGDVKKCMLTEKSQTLKLDALGFLRLVFELHRPAVLQSFIGDMLPLVISAVSEDWYKIIAEALRVLGVIIRVMRPRDPDTGMFHSDFDYACMATPIYAALKPRLEALDIDQEIKECAISTVGVLFAHLGDELASTLPEVLVLLRARLSNEITRPPTLKTLSNMASSPLNLNLSSVLRDNHAEIAHFLRQQARSLKQTTLLTLEALIVSPSAFLSDELAAVVHVEAANLVSDSDLHLACLALKMLHSLYVRRPSAQDSLRQHIYPRIIELAASSLLQGMAQQALIALIQELVATNAPGMSFDDILSALYQRATTSGGASASSSSSTSSSSAAVMEVSDGSSGSSGGGSKQSTSNIALCIAGICLKVPEATRNATVQKLASSLSPGQAEAKRHLALLCIGELGQQVDLSAASSNLKDLILTCFDSASEDTKTAAAYALGHLAVGNMATFLPVVLRTVESNRHQYLLLAALKEIIVVHANNGMSFEGYLPAVLPGLIAQCKADAEGVRSMVAECLGLATFMHATLMVPSLKSIAETEAASPLARWTVITSMRYALSRPVSPSSFVVDDLRDATSHFLPLLTDEDLDVRRAALFMTNTAVYHNCDVVRPFLDRIVPVLLETLLFKQERVMDLGPFKHKVDDGLPLRKAALTCAETILDMAPERIDVGAFMPGMVLALDDEPLKLQSHQVLTKLCAYAPGAVLGSVDQIVVPLEKTITKKVKDNAATGPEAERAQELVKSCLRAVVVLNKLDEINTDNVRWKEFQQRLAANPKVEELLQALSLEKSDS